MAFEEAVNRGIEAAGDLIQTVVNKVGEFMDNVTQALREQAPSGQGILSPVMDGMANLKHKVTKGGKSTGPSAQRKNQERTKELQRAKAQEVGSPGQAQSKFAKLDKQYGLNVSKLNKMQTTNMGTPAQVLGTLNPYASCAHQSMSMSQSRSTGGRAVGRA